MGGIPTDASVLRHRCRMTHHLREQARSHRVDWLNHLSYLQPAPHQNSAITNRTRFVIDTDPSPLHALLPATSVKK
jgi:hypothetical protein